MLTDPSCARARRVHSPEDPAPTSPATAKPSASGSIRNAQAGARSGPPRGTAPAPAITQAASDTIPQTAAR